MPEPTLVNPGGGSSGPPGTPMALVAGLVIASFGLMFTALPLLAPTEFRVSGSLVATVLYVVLLGPGPLAFGLWLARRAWVRHRSQGIEYARSVDPSDPTTVLKRVRSEASEARRTRWKVLLWSGVVLVSFCAGLVLPQNSDDRGVWHVQLALTALAAVTATAAWVVVRRRARRGNETGVRFTAAALQVATVGTLTLFIGCVLGGNGMNGEVTFVREDHGVMRKDTVRIWGRETVRTTYGKTVTVSGSSNLINETRHRLHFMARSYGRGGGEARVESENPLDIYVQPYSHERLDVGGAKFGPNLSAPSTITVRGANDPRRLSWLTWSD
jgi:hypothetical protein